MTGNGKKPAVQLQGSFNAEQYLVKLRGKEYLEVKWRLLWLRTEHPDAVIETDMVSHMLDIPMAVFKATVKIPLIAKNEDGSPLVVNGQPLIMWASATGWGQEEAADFGDYLEKAETKAIGRACAALGFGTQFAFDHDYEDGRAESGRVVDTPAQRRQRPPARQPAQQAPAASKPAPAPAPQATAAPAGQGTAAPAAPPADPPAPEPSVNPVKQEVLNAPPADPNAPMPITQVQIDAIVARAKEAKLSGKECNDLCKQRHGGKGVKQLSRREGVEFHNHLKELVEKAKREAKA